MSTWVYCSTVGLTHFKYFQTWEKLPLASLYTLERNSLLFMKLCSPSLHWSKPESYSPLHNTPKYWTISHNTLKHWTISNNTPKHCIPFCSPVLDPMKKWSIPVHETWQGGECMRDIYEPTAHLIQCTPCNQCTLHIVHCTLLSIPIFWMLI